MDRRRNNIGVVAVFVAALASLLLIASSPSVSAQPSTDYVRPAASPVLPLDHPLIARRGSLRSGSGASPSWSAEEKKTTTKKHLLGRKHRPGSSSDDGDDDASAPSPPPPPAGPHDPEQLMLSLAGPGAMAVTWVTHPQEDEGMMLSAKRNGELGRRHRASGCDHLAGLPLESVVRYGPAPSSSSSSLSVDSIEDLLPLLAVGKFTCYEADDYLSGALHSATMGAGAGGPLIPGTRYAYSVGSPSLGAWSSVRTFLAPASPDAGSLPYRIAVVGDLGQTENSAATLERMRAVSDFVDNNGILGGGGGGDGEEEEPTPPGHVLNVGDLSYADGFQPRWDSWGRLVEPYASEVPWMVIEGNHEEELAVSGGGSGGDGDDDDDDDDVDGFVAYRARFAVPSNASGSGSKLYYSYEVPGAHVVMLGTYADWSPGSKQRAWLASDLARVDRGRTPWLLVGMHAPWYSSNTAHLDEVDGMRRSLEPLLLQHGADVVFTGHVHAYERTGRVARRRADARGPLHIVVGDGGNREGLSVNYLDPAPRWSAFREASYGHGALDLLNSTHAVWRWVRNGGGAEGGGEGRGDGDDFFSFSSSSNSSSSSSSSKKNNKLSAVSADETWIVRGEAAAAGGGALLERSPGWWFEEEEEEGERGQGESARVVASA